MEQVMVVEKQELVEEINYILDKATWDKYNMVETRLNVIEFIREYKEARAKNIQAVLFAENGLTSKLDPNKVFMPSRRNNGGFADNSNMRIDTEEELKKKIPVINAVIKSFTPEERKYYDFCLANNNSEEYLCNALNLSKTGLQPIKNSCILKIAFAFKIEVKK